MTHKLQIKVPAVRKVFDGCFQLFLILCGGVLAAAVSHSLVHLCLKCQWREHDGKE